MALAVGVAIAVWRTPDFAEIAEAYAGVNWLLVAAAFGANAVSITCHGLVWRLTLRQAVPGRIPPTRRVLAVHWIGHLGNLLFPARAGEATRVGLLLRHVERDGAWPAVTGSALAHRLLEAVPVALLVVLALVVAPVPGWARGLLLGLVGVITAGLVVALVAARKGGAGEEGGEEPGDESIGSRLRRGLGVVRAPLPTAAALAVSTAAIGSQLLGLWLLLLAFGLDVPLIAAVVVLLLAEIAVVFPLWPGNVGVYQAVVAGGLLAFGVPYTTGLAYGLAAQALDTAVAATAGTAGLVMEGVGLAELRGEEG